MYTAAKNDRGSVVVCVGSNTPTQLLWMQMNDGKVNSTRL